MFLSHQLKTDEMGMQTEYLLLLFLWTSSLVQETPWDQFTAVCVCIASFISLKSLKVI